MITKEWIKHWIYDHLSVELIVSKTFEEWMWTPERYNTETLSEIKRVYNKRRKELSNG